MDFEEQKLKSAERALDFVREGMTLGLGTGSTAAKFVDLIGERAKQGFRVKCIPTSEATRRQAQDLGILLTTLDETPQLDLTVDGADEMDGELRLIKGGGGALLREKIVAMASDLMIVIADSSKLVESLGKFPLPVEIDRFGVEATKIMVESLAEEVGCRGAITIRRDDQGEPFLTDGGNYILDCAFGKIPEPEDLEEALSIVPGVVETGLFIGIADKGIVGVPDGVTLVEPPELEWEED